MVMVVKNYDGCTDLHSMLKLGKVHEKYLFLITLKDMKEENLKAGLREVIEVMKRK